jgi:hypothetical protein
MSVTHVVAPGDCMVSIAGRYGFSDYKKIWEDSANQALRKKRPDPNVLFPGDEVIIPDKKKKDAACPPGAHKFVVTFPKRKLKLKLGDGTTALAGRKYLLKVGKLEIEGKTTGDGLVEQDLPANAVEAELIIAGATMKLRLGDLNPMKDVPDGGISGVQARLRNLGYAPGAINGDLNERTMLAIRLFQEDNKLEVTGAVDDALLAKLEELHGS